jgi:ATP-dependent DNA helicase RecG
MQTPAETLLKFLKLEIEKKYDNRAVIGGLERVLPAWQSEARTKKIDEKLITDITNEISHYSQATLEERKDIVARLVILLQKIGSVALMNTPPQNKPVLQNPAAKVKPSPKPVLLTVPPKSVEVRPPQQYLSNTPGLGIDTSVDVIPGVGKSRADDLKKLHLETLRDVLYYFPRRYDDYSQLKTINRIKFGETLTVIGVIQNVYERELKAGSQRGVKSITEAVIVDGTGSLRLTWFNQPYLQKQLLVGNQIVVSGKVDSYLGRLVMNSPDWEPIEVENLHTNRIVPVYPLKTDVSQKWLRRIVFQTVNHWATKVDDFLPADIVKDAELVNLSTALKQIHFPDNQDQLNSARTRLSFDEIFLLQMGVRQQKRDWQSSPARVFSVPDEWIQSRIKDLPFQLTNAQNKSFLEICSDLASGKPMNRLLQGDVGSGKTILAALAAEIIAKGDAQSALLSPTSILAEQHFQTMIKFLCFDEGKSSIRKDEIQLLTGDVPEKEKEILRNKLKSGEVKLIVGTHALLEDPIEFKNLQLAIIDEQHRFGVEQRAKLRLKGNNLHLLVMTATPIPRSLALTVYGDLDLSVLDELPAGRQIIETHLLLPAERERAYQLVKSTVEKKQQVFIIYPLIEKGDNDEVKAAVAEYERLSSDVFPNLNVGLLHGKVKPEEKTQVMDAFRKNEIQILVSTSVVEVGVDIPNATLMLVEGANHFGLAQLHQFRGRIGRGTEKSICLLIPDTEDSMENERLLAMTQTNDGFVLAEKDLAQRGPGDFMGYRQSGFSDLRLASIMDLKTIEKARKYAEMVFEKDPNLSEPVHLPLKKALAESWSPTRGDIS